MPIFVIIFTFFSFSLKRFITVQAEKNLQYFYVQEESLKQAEWIKLVAIPVRKRKGHNSHFISIHTDPFFTIFLANVSSQSTLENESQGDTKESRKRLNQSSYLGDSLLLPIAVSKSSYLEKRYHSVWITSYNIHVTSLSL